MESIEELIESDWSNMDAQTENKALMLIALYLMKIAEALATNSNK